MNVFFNSGWQITSVNNGAISVGELIQAAGGVMTITYRSPEGKEIIHHYGGTGIGVGWSTKIAVEAYQKFVKWMGLYFKPQRAVGNYFASPSKFSDLYSAGHRKVLTESDLDIASVFVVTAGASVGGGASASGLMVYPGGLQLPFFSKGIGLDFSEPLPSASIMLYGFVSKSAF